jgi:hypothetical protein
MRRVRKCFASILVITLAALIVFNCGCKGLADESHASTSNSTSPLESAPTNFSSIPMATSPPWGYGVKLSSAPKLGETANATFVLDIRREAETASQFKFANWDPKHCKAGLEFYWTNINGSYEEAKQAVAIPLSEVLVTGNATWVGDAFLNNHKTLINCTVKLPREGIWHIVSYFYGEGGKKPSAFSIFGGLTSGYNVAVTAGSAAIMSDQEFSRGPLGYLGNFRYGSVPDRTLNETSDPILLVLDISNAPKVGEEAVLTCRITSLHDVADFQTRTTFTKWQKATTGTEIPGKNLLVKGDFAWRGSLKAGQAVEFSATIKFPEAGDWQVLSAGYIPTTGAGYSDVIKMTIASNRGSFGWQPYPQPSFNITIPGVPVPSSTK